MSSRTTHPRWGGIAFVIGLVVAACTAPITPTPTLEPALSLASVCDAEHVGQTRVVEGFFIYPDTLTADPALNLILSTGPGGVEPYVHVRVPVGTGPNHVEPPPADASDQDLRVHTSANEMADMSRQVRVSGLVTAGDMGDGTTCYLETPIISLAAGVNQAP